eukprot:4825960-Pleurochrysis_carterae.AAC.7
MSQSTREPLSSEELTYGSSRLYTSTHCISPIKRSCRWRYSQLVNHAHIMQAALFAMHARHCSAGMSHAMHGMGRSAGRQAARAASA